MINGITLLNNSKMIGELNNYIDKHDVDVENPQNDEERKVAAMYADLTGGSPPGEENYDNASELFSDFVRIINVSD